MPRRGRFKTGGDESNFDINLAPMLDIIVSIVPMLLLSAVFFKITVVDTKVPQPVAQAKIEKKQEKEVSVKLSISTTKGFELTLVENGKENKFATGAGLDEDSLTRLRSEATRLKQKHPELFQIELSPEEDVSYAQIIKVMDRVRSKASKEPKFSFVDKETGKTVETELMFPDVVFANVIGG